MSNALRISVIVAHPDDEVLGFGASGARLAAAGATIQPLIFCGEVDARTQRPSDEQLHSDMNKACSTAKFSSPKTGLFPNIRLNTVPHIEMVKFVEEHIREFTPQHIFTHHPGDLNDDHRAVAEAARVGSSLYLRDALLPPLESLNYMEILSSTDWTYPNSGNDFVPDLFQEISEQELALKVKALSCYRDVMRPPPHSRSKEGLEALARYRGGQRGMMFAEAFQCIYRRGI